MAMQWHPLFAELLRALMQDYYEVLTNVPVGDVPREADLVLLRRTTRRASPFAGLWRHLTVWNILEYKGPSVSARLDDLDLLIELGLGIHRRLNEERDREKQELVPAEQVSFWYLVNRLGKRFRRRASRWLGALESVGDGIWRSVLLDRPVLLVSGVDLPIEQDSVPLHLLGQESPEKELALARLVVQEPDLLQRYGQYLGTLHPQTLKELRAMARTLSKGPKFHLKPFLDWIGMQEVIDQVGVPRVIDEVGIKRVIDEVGVQQVIDAVGIKRVIDEVGVEQVMSELAKNPKSRKKALAVLVDDLSPAERADLRRRLDRS